MKNSSNPNKTFPQTSPNELMEYVFQDRMEHLRLLSSALINEIHTPLIIIRGRAESLLRNHGQDTQTGLREISQECQHLLKLLESMAFVGPRSGDLKMHNLPLKKIVNDVLVFFEKACLDKGIVIQSEIPDNIRVESEPDRLKNIIISLISNAVDSFDKADPDNVRSIFIHTQKDAKNLHLIVSDTGCGMSLLTQARIFQETFFSTKSGNQSSGMGLLLAQKMAQDLKIDINFVSEEGKGSSFSLDFPQNIITL